MGEDEIRDGGWATGGLRTAERRADTLTWLLLRPNVFDQFELRTDGLRAACVTEAPRGLEWCLNEQVG